jgi:hypothetical protein
MLQNSITKQLGTTSQTRLEIRRGVSLRVVAAQTAATPTVATTVWCLVMLQNSTH